MAIQTDGVRSIGVSITVIVSLLQAFFCHSAVADKGAPAREFDKSTILVRFQASAAKSARDALCDSVGGVVEHEYSLVPNLICLRINVSVAEALSAFQARPDLVQYAEPNRYLQAVATPNDHLYSSLQWGAINTGQIIDISWTPVPVPGFDQTGTPGADANLEAAWDITTGDADFVIAVIDTGIDHNHLDLDPNIWENPGETGVDGMGNLMSTNGIDDDSNGYIDDVRGWDFVNDDNDTTGDNPFHGSHVAGILGAAGNNGIGIAGVNWRCKIMPLQFLDATGFGLCSDAARAIEYACDKGVKVSNNSYGDPNVDQSLLDAVTAARDMGHLFVAASGNNGNSLPFYPASFDLDNIISVAAVDNLDQLAGFSNFGATSVDLGAPGVGVPSTVNQNGQMTFESLQGTSMASPQVAGAAALLWSAMPGWTFTQVRSQILSTVRPIPALVDVTVTEGTLDVGAALAIVPKPPRIEVIGEIPSALEPGFPTILTVLIDPRDDTLVAGTQQLHLRTNGGTFASSTLTPIGGDLYETQITVNSCTEEPEFYLSVEGANSGTVTLPPEGATHPSAVPAGVQKVAFADSFETDLGWVSGAPGDNATTGIWDRMDPQGTAHPNGDILQPENAFDGAVCWATGGLSLGAWFANDVDNGTTTLTSPVIDLSGAHSATMSYARWYSTDTGPNPSIDNLVIDISDDGGGSWTNAETVGPTGVETSGGWFKHSLRVEDFASLTNSIRIRVIASDPNPTGSVLEAAFDDFRITAVTCCDGDGDSDNDGDLDLTDFDAFAACLDGPAAGLTSGCACFDLNGDGNIELNDYSTLQEMFTRS